MKLTLLITAIILGIIGTFLGNYLNKPIIIIIGLSLLNFLSLLVSMFFI